MRSFFAAASLLMLAVMLFSEGDRSMFATSPIYTPQYSEVPSARVYSSPPTQYAWLVEDSTAPYAQSAFTGPVAEEQSSVGWPDVAMLAVVGSIVAAAYKHTGQRSVVEADLESATIAANIATLAVEGRKASSRRDALFGAASLASLAFAPPAQADAAYTVPPLTYNYSALEPYIDTDTMMFHHDAHHAAYVAKLNGQMEGKPAASLLSLQAGAKEAGLNNSAGGHYNHSMFWTTMGADCGGAPTGELGDAMNKAFGSYDGFKEKWAAASAGVFGSGWAWLVVDKAGAVSIKTTPNQDNPLMDKDGGVPILGIDVWEHAYYLRYKNKRPDYITAFFNVIDWKKVGEYYAVAKTGKGIEFSS